jgi:hypothetical protein
MAKKSCVHFNSEARVKPLLLFFLKMLPNPELFWELKTANYETVQIIST